MEENCEKIWKKSRLNSEMIWNILQKDRLNSEMIENTEENSEKI
jgi:hypothetical protein